MAVTARLRALSGKRARTQEVLLRQKVEDLADDVATDLENALYKYPPPRPGSKYVRTFRLREGWQFTVSSVASGVYIRVRNVVYYVTRVHCSEQGVGQWSIHTETCWPLLLTILQKARLKWVSNLTRIYKDHPIIDWR